MRSLASVPLKAEALRSVGHFAPPSGTARPDRERAVMLNLGPGLLVTLLQPSR